MLGTKNGNGRAMKSAAVVDPLPEAPCNIADVSMHTKQLANMWNVDPRSVTNWIAQVRNLGYHIGTMGERNRTYFSPDEQLLIKAARFNTLTPNPEVEQQYHQQREEQETTAQQEDTAEQNRNLQNRLAIVEQQGQTAIARQDTAWNEGAELAKDELAAKLDGYLQTRAAGEQVFDQLVSELDQKPLGYQPLRRVSSANPKRLENSLF